MFNNNLELAELICTRISHDLIGNIGAISSTLELLRENNNILEDSDFNILSSASKTLTARQKFFRLAFGVNIKNIDINELKSICENYLATLGNQTTPFVLEMNGISPQLAKIVCLGVMCAAEVCIKGGNISIDVNKQNMTVKVCSEYKLSEAKLNVYKEIVAHKKPQENASQYVHLMYLREFLESDVNISISFDENSMNLLIG